MKKLWIMAVLAGMAACSVPKEQAKETNRLILSIANTADINYPKSPVVLTRNELKAYGLEFATGQFPMVTYKDDLVPFQVDDLDQDGTWDELAFVLTLNKGESQSVHITYTDSLPSFPKQARARLGKSPDRNDVFETVTEEDRPADWKPMTYPQLYNSEGPIWENDKVAFRHYFDSRNGRDIFGKLTSEFTLDSLGVKGTQYGDYHKPYPWGMDVLKVGNSLGAGAIALKVGDTLVALNETDKARYQLINDGPIRAIIRLEFTGWEVEGNKHDVVEIISIWPGRYWYQNDVKVTNVSGQKLVAGITNLKNPNPAIQMDLVEEHALLATYAKQSENADNLGMGILVNRSDFAGFGETKKEGKGIVSTYYSTIDLKEEKPSTYYFVAGWEKSHADFATEEAFVAHLEKEAKLLNNPPSITKELDSQ